MLFRDMTFYMIVCTLTKIFHSDLRQIRILLLFMLSVFSLCHSRQSLFQNMELAIRNHAAYKSPFMLLMIATDGGNKTISNVQTYFQQWL